MELKKIEQVQLNKIILNKKNARGKIEVEDLVPSVRSKGVIQPVLLRGVANGRYEIVVGNRRYAAMCVVADEGGATTIPAVVLDKCDDAEKFELMMIENLQRQGLEPLEEAMSFKGFLKDAGEAGLEELAQRTGITAPYIRKKVKALDLPKEILTAWGNKKLVFGHLEQLIRLDPKKRKDIFVQLMEDVRQGDTPTVRELKEAIEEESPMMEWARFDPKKQGCGTCKNNTQVQKTLFDELVKGERCLMPSCFQALQMNWYKANWKDSDEQKKLKTDHVMSRPMFNNLDIQGKFSNFFSTKRVPKLCKACEKFFSVVSVSGEVVDYNKQMCADPACFKVVQKAEQKKDKEKEREKAGTKDKGNGSGSKKEDIVSETSPEWHGEYFREAFYMAALPVWMTKLDRKKNREEMLALQLFALIKSNYALRAPFCKLTGIPGVTHYDAVIWDKIKSFKERVLEDMLHWASTAVIQQKDFNALCRRAVGDYLGINLKTEWRITEEYLEKKTKAQMVVMGEQFGVWKLGKVKEFMLSEFKAQEPRSLKKSELIKCYLESGLMLNGLVPKEILAK